VGARRLAAIGSRLLVVTLAMVGGCRGPRPSVQNVKVASEWAPGFQRVTAVGVNAGGEGQARLKVRLRDARSDLVIESDKQVDLQRHDRVEVVIDVPAPAGEYVPEVEAEYPPR
jgi:hypothetical protein